MRKQLVSAGVAVAVLLGTAGAVQADGDPRQGVFINDLTSAGFEVRSGSQRRIDAAYFVDNHVIDSAAGNNAGQAYKALQVPAVPPGSTDASERSSGVFRLREDEAVVYLGPTPPMGDYFSFTPFLFERRKDSIQPKGDWMFAALGNPLNNMGIKTEGPTPFAANTMIVFTADAGVYDRVKAQAVAAGFPESMVNRYELPSQLLNMGVRPRSDSLLILVRTANVRDAQQNKAFLNDAQYATVLRVTPAAPVTPQPYATVPMAKRAWKSEQDLYPGLAASLDRLKAAILADTPHAKARSYSSTRWWPESRTVLKATKGSPEFHMFVAGEAADTPYRRTSRNGEPTTMPLGKKDMVIVYGVNHAATGLATYSNFSVYSDQVLNPCGSRMYPTRFGCGNPVWSGVTGMANDGFTGSAKKYLPNDPLAKYLYAVKVSRKELAGKYAVTVPAPTKGKPAIGVPAKQNVLIGYRAYLNPNTGRGPAYSDVIKDRAIWLRRH